MPRLKVLPIVLTILLSMVSRSRAEDEAADLAAKYDARITEDERQHWAFQTPKSPELPVVKNRAWVANPIDRFILSGLESESMTPAPAAERRTLLRRVYLDVIGLPPSLEEQESFLRDARPDAYERLVDSLLARPEYGERWARRWLDVVRFAETNGYERDAVKPNAWRYRDYVIRALNQDLPYDRFLTEQLAGDELEDADAESRIATGFLRLGAWDDEPADPLQDEFDQLDDIVSATSDTFLGLTLGCARCHDHKFEPLTQLDYYRMAAIFRPLERPLAGRTELDVPLEGVSAEGESIRAYVMKESPAKVRETPLLRRGSAGAGGPPVDAGMPAVLCGEQPEFLDASETTTQRRLTLARWLTSPDHPLTARVIVNRVWQGHFGEGIVRTPNDFGTSGEAPTHPELLDWLACWFMDNGWSMKRLHALILTSSAYRMSADAETSVQERDPENRRLSHWPRHRLEAEAIRDSVLASSGTLRRRLYGPSVYPEIPRPALESHSDPASVWKPFVADVADRRTIYAMMKRSLMIPMLEVLDVCDATRSAGKRNVTSVAPQALTLYNGDFINRQSRELGSRLIAAETTVPARINLAYRLTLARPPTAGELAHWVEFVDQELRELRETYPGTASRVIESDATAHACRVLFNLNEFVYPD
jgi:hypothetical protein